MARQLHFERLETRELLALTANLTAFRPVTPYIDATQFPVLESQETDLAHGPGIRLNGDDDNSNGQPDYGDIGPLASADDDLVRVDIAGAVGALTIAWTGPLAVWTSPTKQSAIASGSSVASGQQVWVEYASNVHTVGESTRLTLSARSGGATAQDHLVFHSFRSEVIAIGGNDQDPANFGDTRLGAFTIAGTLYKLGYDVHLFSHSQVQSSGAGAAASEAAAAVLSRAVTDLAIIGYSWGGGATYELASGLAADARLSGKYALRYSAYIDGITHSGISSERRLPSAALYHDSLYQRQDALLRGDSVAGANNWNVSNTTWGAGLVHTSIDDNATLQSIVAGNLQSRLSNGTRFVVGFDSASGVWQGSSLAAGGPSDIRSLATWAKSQVAGWQSGVTGDFNGDGVTDVAARNSSGGWQVGASQSNGFATSVWGGFDGTRAWAAIDVGDVDGNGHDDVVGYLPAVGQWWVALSDGNSFTNFLLAQFSNAVNWSDFLVADFTGDGRVDVAARTNFGEWWLGETSSTIGALARLDKLTTWSTAVAWLDVKTGDMNGDGRQDIIGRADFAGSDGSEWWQAQVRLNAPNDYVADLSALAVWYEPVGWTVVVADTDGDGADEILGRSSFGEWWQSNQSLGRDTQKLGHWESAAWQSTLVGDADGDGKDDLLGRKSNGEWIISRFPIGAGSQQNLAAPIWSASADWLFSAVGEDEALLFG